MTIPDYLLNPVNGYLDSVTYPNPANGAIARTQINDLVFQVLNNLNDYKNKLQTTTLGNSGAKQIGFPPISMIGNVTNLEDALINTMNLPQISEAVNARTDNEGNIETNLSNRLSKMQYFVNVKSFGAIGDGNSHPLSSKYSTLAAAQIDYTFADSLTNEIDWCAIQKAINVTSILSGTLKNSGDIKIPKGRYILNNSLVLSQYVHLFGNPRIGGSINANPQSDTELVFNIGSGIYAINGAISSSIDNLVIRYYQNALNTAVGIYAPAYMTLTNVTIMNFGKGIKCDNNYYTTFNNVHILSDSSLAHIGLELNGCYNFNIFGGHISCKTPINLLSRVNPLTIIGGAFEAFDTFLDATNAANSQITIMGTYFESIKDNALNRYGIKSANGCSITLSGCTIYLNGLFGFVKSNGLSNVDITSTGNKFLAASDNPSVGQAFILPSSGSVNLCGDSWIEVLQATATYIGSAYNGNAPQGFNIISPSNSGGNEKEYNVMGRPLMMPILTSSPSVPKQGTIYCADGTTWNPCGLSITTPYLCTYTTSRGWETLDARKSVTQAASTAGDVATLKNDFNTLLTNLKNAKLMA